MDEAGDERDDESGDETDSYQGYSEPMGYIYFIRSPVNDLIKIGKSIHHPDGRFWDAQFMSPVHLEKMGVIRTGIGLEGRLHHQFRDVREHGEWFMSDRDLLDYIQKNASPWPAPDRERRMRGKPVNSSLTASRDKLWGEIHRLHDCLLETGLSKNRIRFMNRERMKKYMTRTIRSGGPEYRAAIRDRDRAILDLAKADARHASEMEKLRSEYESKLECCRGSQNVPTADPPATIEVPASPFKPKNSFDVGALRARAGMRPRS